MRLSLIVLFLVFGTYHKQVYGQLTLEECYEKARENYPLIKQYGLIEKSKEYTLSNANKAFLPQLNVSVIGGVIEGLPAAVVPGMEASSSSATRFDLVGLAQLSQSIWDGGATKAKKEIAVVNSEIDKAELEVSLYSIKEQVNNLYFGIILLNEQLMQLDLTKNNLQEHLERTQISVENGTAYHSDVDEISVEILNNDQQMTDLKHNRGAYMHALSAMIGQPISEQEKLVRPLVDEDYASLPINRPELNKYNNQEGLLVAQSKKDRATLYPTVGVTAIGFLVTPGINLGPTNFNSILVAGLNLSWNLGGLYQNGNNKNLTEINTQKIRLQRETFMYNTNLQLTQSEKEIEKYQTFIQQDRELLELKSSIKKSYEVKYENGVSTMSDLLDRINDENLAKQNLIMHEIQYLMSAYDIKNTSGN